MDWRTTGKLFSLIAAMAAAPLPALAFGQPSDVEPFAAAPVLLPAPDLELPTAAGGAFRLSARRGKVTVVNFWALWCAPCLREMPALGRLKSNLAAHDIDVVAVNLGDDGEAVERFLGRTETGALTVLLDGKSATAGTWHVGGLPVTYVIDRAGRISHAALGARDWDMPPVVRWLEKLASGKVANGGGEPRGD